MKKKNGVKIIQTADYNGPRTVAGNLHMIILLLLLNSSSFVITGPSTTTTSVGKMLAGQANLAGGAVVGDVTQCLTDTFSITNQNTVPVICGTNSGFHGK